LDGLFSSRVAGAVRNIFFEQVWIGHVIEEVQANNTQRAQTHASLPRICLLIMGKGAYYAVCSLAVDHTVD